MTQEIPRTFEVLSSNGFLLVDAATGEIDRLGSLYIPSEGEPDLVDTIVRFDVKEWEKYYGLPIEDVDILDIGYWHSDAKTNKYCYEPPIDQCRGAYTLSTNMTQTIEQKHTDMVAALLKSGAEVLAALTPEQANLWHLGTGVAGESGELIDAVKRWVIYQKPLDLANVEEELGDLEFYLEGVRQATGITREQTLENNRAKLLTSEKARYKLGVYTDKQAQDRSDKS